MVNAAQAEASPESATPPRSAASRARIRWAPHEVLEPNVGRIPNHCVVRLAGGALEEVTDVDTCVTTDFENAASPFVGAPLMQLRAVQSRAFVAELDHPLGSVHEELCIARGRLEHAILSVAQRPLNDEGRDRGRREEGPTLLAQRGGIEGIVSSQHHGLIVPHPLTPGTTRETRLAERLCRTADTVGGAAPREELHHRCHP